jgi:hypothetical protein
LLGCNPGWKGFTETSTSQRRQLTLGPVPHLPSGHAGCFLPAVNSACSGCSLPAASALSICCSGLGILPCRSGPLHPQCSMPSPSIPVDHVWTAWLDPSTLPPSLPFQTYWRPSQRVVSSWHLPVGTLAARNNRPTGRRADEDVHLDPETRTSCRQSTLALPPNRCYAPLAGHKERWSRPE